jgi:hypothetical protein
MSGLVRHGIIDRILSLKFNSYLLRFAGRIVLFDCPSVLVCCFGNRQPGEVDDACKHGRIRLCSRSLVDLMEGMFHVDIPCSLWSLRLKASIASS